jgi:predicted dehydrogenase
MQRRSEEHFRQAVEYVASGKLGKICLVKAWMCQVRRSIGNPPDEPAPPGVDYDVWLGPAPKRPFNRNRFHYNWRFFWDYGNTELGNQGVHMLDVALWGIQMMRKAEKCLPVRISEEGGIYWLDDAKEVPDTQVVNYDFGDFLLVWELRSFNGGNAVEGTQAGTGFYGTEGALIVDGNGWRVQGRKGEPGPSAPKAPFEHEKNFLECVKSRQRPNADIEIGRLSTTLCHLGNISHHLKRSIRFDPATETFPGDAEATALMSKSYRDSWPLPKV